MSALLNLGDKITAGNRADATFFYKKRVADDSGTLLTEAETDANNRELLAQSLFDKASVVYTAGGVKASKAYSVKGTDFTVTRAGLVDGIKRVIGRDGLLTEIPANTPATEFSGGVLKGTLIEPARTNLVLRSEEFDNAYWASTDVTITPNAVIAPNGEQTADNITFSEASGNVRITLSGFAVVSGSTITISLYAKTSVQIVTFGGATTIAGTNVYSFEDVGNGYFRQKVTRTYSASGTSNAQFLLNNTNFGAGTVAVWGAQLETGSVATSYIKTVDTTITQPADVITATGLGSVLPQTEGWMYAEVDWLNSVTNGRLITLFESANNRIDLRNASSNTILAVGVSNGVSQFGITSTTFTRLGKGKVLLRFASNSVRLFINGALVGSNNTATFPFFATLDKVAIGAFFDDSSQFNDPIHSIAIGIGPISDAEAITLTTL
jgi:hypothetical protein